MSTIGETIDRRDDCHHALTARQTGFKPAWYFRWKDPLDRCAAVMLLVPGLPLIACLAVLVRLTSKGPGIYRQARVGKDGRRFMMYKIRTMRLDAETESGPVWTQPQDPRMTSLGRLLRKLHLDELPQLFNVLKGEMSLVGPRPERPEFVCVLAEAVPGYRNRLAVRPGITGLAQINLPPDTDLVSVQRKIRAGLRVYPARRPVVGRPADALHVSAALQAARRPVALFFGPRPRPADTVSAGGRGPSGRGRRRRYGHASLNPVATRRLAGHCHVRRERGGHGRGVGAGAPTERVAGGSAAAQRKRSPCRSRHAAFPPPARKQSRQESPGGRPALGKGR